jgi:hypothetical protein
VTETRADGKGGGGANASECEDESSGKCKATNRSRLLLPTNASGVQNSTTSV